MKKIVAYFAGLLLLQCHATVFAVPAALTDGMGVADFADFRTSTSDSLHLVWHDANVDGGAIFYKLFDPNGNVLIDRTQVDDLANGNTNTRPAIEINSAGLVFVIWEDTTAAQVRFMRLDPSQALLDGNPTTQALIKDQVIGEVILGNNAAHPRMRIDTNGDLHVVWESTAGGDVQYLKIDPDGIILNGPLSLPTGGSNSGNDFPHVDVDTGGNAHIVFGNIAPLMLEKQVYYAMVDGDPAAMIKVPIAPTLLTVDDDLRAGSATVSVDTFDDTIYIVMKQALVNQVNDAEEIFLSRLNPALDDRNGDAADPAVLKLFEQQITAGEGLYQWHVTSHIGRDSRIHATYIDFNQGNCSAPYSIIDRHITFAGKTIAVNILTTTGSATTCDPRPRGAPDRNRIVWTDNSTGALEIWSTTFARADAGDSGFTCSLRNRNATGWQVGDLWLLFAAIAGLGVWRKCRKQYRA